MAPKKKMLNRGKTKIREQKEKFSKKTRTKKILNNKTEMFAKKSIIIEKLQSATKTDCIQISIIIILTLYLLFVVLKFHEII